MGDELDLNNPFAELKPLFAQPFQKTDTGFNFGIDPVEDVLKKASPAGEDNGFSMLKMLLGGTDNATGDKINGALPIGMQALGGLAQSWLGLQQTNLMKDQFALQKDAYRTNMANQTKLTNSQIESQYRDRLAANGGQGNMLAMDDYMAKNGVKASV